jgi:hypothetical protein
MSRKFVPTRKPFLGAVTLLAIESIVFRSLVLGFDMFAVLVYSKFDFFLKAVRMDVKTC